MNRLKSLGAASLGAVTLASCSTVQNINPFGPNTERAEAEAADRAGRIAMVSAESLLEADPALAATAVILPDARTVEAWPQSGGVPAKVVGHVRAGENLNVDWRWSSAAGSTRDRTLTAAPVAADGKLFMIDAAQTVHAIDANTGASVWRQRLDSGNRRDKYAFGGGIAIAGDRVIVASGFGFVASMDIETGAEVWRTRTDAPMTGSPTIVGTRAFVASNNNEFYSIDLATGQIEWTDQAIAEPARVLSSPSPAAVDDFVVAPYSSGEVIAYLPSNGRRLWSDSLTRAGRFTPISAINDIASRPVLNAGVVYASSQSGVLAAIDGRTGTRIWNLPLGATQAPALAGEFLFVVSVDAEVACVEATTGRVVWVQKLDGFGNMEEKKNRISYSGPVIASNRLVLASSDGRVLALSPQTGEVLEERELVITGRFSRGSGFFIEPIVYQGRIYLLSDGGTIFAIG